MIFWLPNGKEGTSSDNIGLSKCKKLVLTHFVPTNFNKNKLKKVVKKDFGKNPIIGEDLMTIKV